MRPTISSREQVAPVVIMALPELYGGCHATRYCIPVIKVQGCHDIMLTLATLRLRLAGAQGAIVAPTLVSVSPVRSQVGTSRFNASPIGISVGVAEAEEPNSTFSDGTAPGTLAGAGR